MLATEISQHSALYMRAIYCSVVSGSNTGGEEEGGTAEEKAKGRAKAKTDAAEFAELAKRGAGEGEVTCRDFCTGIISLNRVELSQLDDEQKRKRLFGSDQIVP